jgi:hypothetical protein
MQGKVMQIKVKRNCNSREQVLWQMAISFVLVVTISEAHHVLYQLDA